MKREKIETDGSFRDRETQRPKECFPLKKKENEIIWRTDYLQIRRITQFDFRHQPNIKKSIAYLWSANNLLLFLFLHQGQKTPKRFMHELGGNKVQRISEEEAWKGEKTVTRSWCFLWRWHNGILYRFELSKIKSFLYNYNSLWLVSGSSVGFVSLWVWGNGKGGFQYMNINGVQRSFILGPVQLMVNRSANE